VEVAEKLISEAQSE